MKKLDFHDMLIPIVIPNKWISDKVVSSYEVVYAFNGEKPLALYGCFGNISTETFYQIQKRMKNEK